MNRRRLLLLALVVTVLLAVVGIAAHGRPLGKGSGSNGGLPLSFWSWVFTTLLIVFLLLFVAGLVAVLVFRRERTEVASYNRRTLRTLAVLLIGGALLAYFGHKIDLQKLLHPNGSNTTTAVSGPTVTGKGGKGPQQQHVQFRWEELVVVLALLVALAAAAAVSRSRLGPGSRPRRVTREVLAAALDESLDDLRADPDLRRAIIAAYARMETALAAAGLPREPAEAPLEYLERALFTLDTSAEAVRRLTDLFEWARFSQHEPDASMRDEAVDALVAVRDELRESELTPA